MKVLSNFINWLKKKADYALGWLFVFFFYYICYLLFGKDFDFIKKLNPHNVNNPSGSLFFDLYPWLLAHLLTFLFFGFIVFIIWRIIFRDIFLHILRLFNKKK